MSMDLTGALAPRPAPAPFTFPETGQHLRTILIGGEPWFVAVDVCAVLEIGNARQAVSYLDDDEKQQVSATVISNDGGGTPWIVSESGLYSLILRSRKPQAKAFKRWITHEVIPSIRRSGGYTSPLADPLAELELANDRLGRAIGIAKQERARAELATARVAELEPAAEAWDALASTGRDYSAREAAYILNRDPAITTGQNLLLGRIRQLRMVDPFDRPYADHKTHLTLRPQSYTDSDGVVQDAKPQLRITYAGLKYLHKKLGGTAQLRLEAGEDR